jgi:3-oxoacyl-[acyl-carrier protein] reductase
MARLFAENGADIAVNDVNESRIAETIALVEETGGKAIAAPFDVTDFNATQKEVARVSAELGGIDIFCGNAGIAPTVDFIDMTPEAWDRMIKVHLYGAFNGCKAVLPGMLEQSWGRIIITASMSAVSGDRHLTHYSAAKAGQVGLVRALAREVVDRGVTVNAIAPGLVKTNILGEVDDEVIQKYLPPVGRIGQPRDQACAALYLASDDAEFVTGHLLQVNGGSF